MTAFVLDEHGSTAVEYALIAAIISIVIVAALSVIGSHIKTMFQSIVF